MDEDFDFEIWRPVKMRRNRKQAQDILHWNLLHILYYLHAHN